MRLINISNLTSDMELAKPIYYNGNILLRENCSNLNRYKSRLKKLGIKHIYVNDALSEGIEVNDIINSKVKRDGELVVKETMQRLKQNKKIKVNQLNNVVKNLLDEVYKRDSVLINLINIKNVDDYTFEHSVNVAVLSLLLGNSLNYDKQKLIKLGVGALLHDIGKVFIPEGILKKPSRLTEEEYEIVKQHTQLGYRNMKEYYNISPLSRIVILSHHERVDGSGYPKGLNKDDIHEFARVTAIADVFDALASDRCYRDGKPISKVVDFLLSKAGKYFDVKLIKEFISNIAIYPNGTNIKLSTGEKAIVERQNAGIATRPVVRVIEDSRGRKLNRYKRMDLAKRLNVVIESAED